MHWISSKSLTGRAVHEATRVDFFASHEGLHLLYEQAQTRFIARQNRWYNLSTHMPWIGMRTAQVDGAHVEYFRGIANPIGVKIGAAMDDQWLQQLVTTLNPQNQPGRLTLIHRFGAKDIEKSLPRVIEAGADRAYGAVVLRSDARQYRDQHRGTQDPALREYPEGTRSRVSHPRAARSYLGGAHIELTGEDVTECTGGARGLTDADLQRAYRSQVDPRLNYEQALELAMLIAERSKQKP
jgi:3-deoxy-7-phosphoheptulonate synthase